MNAGRLGVGIRHDQAICSKEVNGQCVDDSKVFLASSRGDLGTSMTCFDLLHIESILDTLT